MLEIKSSEDLLQQLRKMNKDHSVSQFRIPGKGKFTVVFQEGEDDSSIQSEISSDNELKQMIHDSRRAYKEKKVMDTSEIIKSFSPRDFS